MDVLFLHELRVFFLVAWRQLYVLEMGGLMDISTIKSQNTETLVLLHHSPHTVLSERKHWPPLTYGRSGSHSYLTELEITKYTRRRRVE